MDKKIIRKFGFKKDQQGIINRYIRESGGWGKHLETTKEFIIKSAKFKNKKSCIVLGSGWLLDVPIDELSQLFDKVILVDIIHPPQVVHKIKKLSNVEIVEADISGFIEPVYHFMKAAKKQKLGLNQIKPVYHDFWLNDIKNVGFVVSVNILNQLDILICDYIIKFDLFSTPEIDEFRKIIQQNHLNAMPKGKSCLITDYEELHLDEKSEIVGSKKLVHIDLPQKTNSEKWQWDFDMNKTYHNNINTVFKVLGVEA